MPSAELKLNITSFGWYYLLIIYLGLMYSYKPFENLKVVSTWPNFSIPKVRLFVCPYVKGFITLRSLYGKLYYDAHIHTSSM